jgi:hypothetical protein
MSYPFDAIQELLSDQAHSQYSFHLPLILAIDRDRRLGVYCLAIYLVALRSFSGANTGWTLMLSGRSSL